MKILSSIDRQMANRTARMLRAQKIGCDRVLSRAKNAHRSANSMAA
jgi:hypothetical protein